MWCIIKTVKQLEKLTPPKTAFLQALGLSVYISLIATIMWNVEKWMPVKSILGPILFLTLFSVSVLTCGFLALGYPIYLFWIAGRKPEAIKTVAYTTLWLILFMLIVLLAILIT